jgi:hypothetical protein
MGKTYGTLREEMDRLAAFVVEQTSEEESEIPYLHLYGSEGITLVAMPGMPGAEMARMIRVTVLLEEPEMAVFQTEGWTLRPDIGPDDPDRRRLELGEITPSTLPPDKRGEVLWLIGESAAGDVANRAWYIEPKGSDKRRLEEMDLGGAEIQSRFQPMFVLDNLIRTIETGISTGGEGYPAELAEKLREISQEHGLTHDRMRELAKPVLARLLASGRGGSTKSFRDSQERVHREIRQEIIHRRGPAKSS